MLPRFTGMFADWLPSWWCESAVYQWITGRGAWLVPWYLHLSSLFLEWTAFHRLICAAPKRAGRFRLWRATILTTHGLLVFLSSSILDGGLAFYRWSAPWAVFAAALGCIAVVAARHFDAKMKRTLLKYVNLRRSVTPKGIHESRMS